MGHECDFLVQQRSRDLLHPVNIRGASMSQSALWSDQSVIDEGHIQPHQSRQSISKDNMSLEQAEPVAAVAAPPSAPPHLCQTEATLS